MGAIRKNFSIKPPIPADDASRWNTRYQQENRESFQNPRSFLVNHVDLLPTHGLALDVAMGLGGNASLLLQRGLRVIGVDISEVAVRQAKTHLPDLMAVVADLAHFHFPPATFDLILNFFYLQRNLWPVYVRALRPGGILVLETLTEAMLTIHPEIPPRYLLQPTELSTAFPCLETLVYQEGWQNLDSRHPRSVASLIARLPAIPNL
jgi:tellurite methyltransferase